MEIAALMEIFPNNIQDQLLLRMGEIGENYEAMRENSSSARRTRWSR